MRAYLHMLALPHSYHEFVRRVCGRRVFDWRVDG